MTHLFAKLTTENTEDRVADFPRNCKKKTAHAVKYMLPCFVCVCEKWEKLISFPEAKAHYQDIEKHS